MGVVISEFDQILRHCRNDKFRAAPIVCEYIANDGMPVYVFNEADLPPHLQYSAHNPYSSTTLDVQMRPLLERLGVHRGRGHSFCVRESYGFERYENEFWWGLVLHEFGHNLTNAQTDYYASCDAVEIPESYLSYPMANAERVLRENPRWFQHEHEWIRRTLHLVHRAAGIGLDLMPHFTCIGTPYGMGDAFDYQAALADELAAFPVDAPLSTLPRLAPLEFLKLWFTDLKRAEEKEAVTSAA